MPFMINGSQPPQGARPHGKGYHLHRPEAKGRNGNDEPVQAVGLSWVEIILERVSITGWDWWVAQVGVGNLSTTKTNIQTYNPYKSGGADFSTFSTGILHMPTAGNISYGAFEEVRIMITSLEE